MTEPYRTHARDHVKRALDGLLDAADDSIEGHRSQFESITAKDAKAIAQPVDWAEEAKTFAKRVVDDAKKFTTIWWEMVRALAADEALQAGPGGRHERTMKLEGGVKSTVTLTAGPLRRFGGGHKPVVDPYVVTCEPAQLPAGSTGAFKVVVQCGGMKPGIYVGTVTTDSPDHPDMEYSIYVSEVDQEAPPPRSP